MFLQVIYRLVNFFDIYQRGILQLLSKAAPLTHGELLDVGCGKKPYQYLFTPYVSGYQGIEKRATFTMTYDATHAKPDYYYDGHCLPFEEARFDTVVSFSVLEHTPEPGLLFSEMARVLKKNGTLILHVPFSYRLHEEPHDYHRFSHHALAYYCKKNDLHVQAIQEQGNIWSTLGHKMLTLLAFNVLRLGKIAQWSNKLGMEKKITQSPRYLLLPFIFPIMVVVIFITRLLERIAPIQGEPLAFLVIAKK